MMFMLELRFIDPERDDLHLYFNDRENANFVQRALAPLLGESLTEVVLFEGAANGEATP